MIDRLAKIKARNFTIGANDKQPLDFAKLSVGTQSVNDAIVSYGTLQKVNPRLTNKQKVLDAIDKGDVTTMREISNFFYRESGIYMRLCRYMAYLYKYDWFITPYVDGLQGLLDTDSGLADMSTDEKQLKQRKKIFADFMNVLNFFDDFEVKRFCGEVALKVIRNGCYYGYIINQGNRAVVQQLVPTYCRSRLKVNNRPVIEFNMKFFDDYYKNAEQIAKILAIFPKDFQKGYKLYKQKKLPPMFEGDTEGWYLLEPKACVKFSMTQGDYPPFISVVPYLIDLDNAQGLDQKRMEQKLLKIILQKMPLDKNGDLIFDPDQAKQLHNNAIRMLGNAIGINVLTTFAEVDVADMGDRSNQSNIDQLEKVERTVFNESGVSQKQFNSDSNTALNNSILNDAASMHDLVLQFESFLNLLLTAFNKSPKRCYYRVQILDTTIYNYQEVSKLYKEQMQVGLSKMLPQVALGQTQSAILATAYFENDILDLVRVFIPPMMSSTMNAEALTARKEISSKDATVPNSQGKQSGTPGRREKQDNEKSQKTLQNRESL